LANTASATAWLSGWDMPLENAIAEVLAAEAASHSG